MDIPYKVRSTIDCMNNNRRVTDSPYKVWSNSWHNFTSITQNVLQGERPPPGSKCLYMQGA